MNCPLKISIPVEIKNAGGVYTFLNNFINYLNKNSISYTSNVEGDENILFTNSWLIPYRVIRKAKKRNKNLKVVHRIDGSAQDYGRTDNADCKQARINTLADITIFQSSYGKYATTKKFPIIKNSGPVIYNPVDVDTFTPEGEKTDFPYDVKICCVSFSSNKKKGADKIFDYAKRHKDYNFILCGRYDIAASPGNIDYLGVLDKEELSRIMRSCDLFFFPSENETCPNVVLEALASGLPVIYEHSGGTSELVGESGFPLRADSGFADDVNTIMQRKAYYSERARKRAVELFSPEVIFPKYIEAFVAAERKAVANITFRDWLNVLWGK